MTEPIQRWKLEFDLRQLGNSPQMVASVLRAHGVKGYRMSWCACPIANLLSERYGCEVAVTDKHVTVGEIKVHVPDPVGLFVLYFDDGAFPDLEKVDLPSMLLG